MGQARRYGGQAGSGIRTALSRVLVQKIAEIVLFLCNGSHKFSKKLARDAALKKYTLPLSALALAMLGSNVAQAQQPEVSAADNPMEDVNVEEFINRIELPEGFEISLYATGVEGARSMEMGEDGTLYVGTMGPIGGDPIGKLYAVTNNNGDGEADEVITLAEDMRYPNGVALRDGDLYVAEIGQIVRFNDIANNLESPGEPEVINDEYPDEFHHGWKYINFGPDGKLYVPVGAPCNICEVEDPFGTITRMDPDGSNMEVYARGVRNSVGFDWHPETGELWFTDNGRDVWGNDRPPEELNHAPEAGLHFGFPHRYGKDLVDDEFPTDMSAEEFTPSVLEMPAHTAGLGIEFYTGEMFPQEYRNQLFAAYHGSWNRNPPQGYKLRLMRFEDGQAAGYEDFATGWLIEDQYWGRPVDIELMQDGSMLVSDDHNGVIYRITYQDQNAQ